MARVRIKVAGTPPTIPKLMALIPRISPTMRYSTSQWTRRTEKLTLPRAYSSFPSFENQSPACFLMNRKMAEAQRIIRVALL